MVETLAAEDDSQPLVEVPLFVFNQSSSLMSDRATQAMEKALRNLANPMCVRLFFHLLACSFAFLLLLAVIKIVVVVHNFVCVSMCLAVLLLMVDVENV